MDGAGWRQRSEGYSSSLLEQLGLGVEGGAYLVEGNPERSLNTLTGRHPWTSQQRHGFSMDVRSGVQGTVQAGVLGMWRAFKASGLERFPKKLVSAENRPEPEPQGSDVSGWGDEQEASHGDQTEKEPW